MIRFVSYSDVDKKKWDNCIRFARNGLPYAYSWYLDSVCEYWDGLIYKDYEAVFPLTWNKKFGISYMYQPFFAQQLGVFSPESLTKDLIDGFLDKIPTDFKLVDIQLNTVNPVDHDEFEVHERVTHHLDLDRRYDELTHSYD